MLRWLLWVILIIYSILNYRIDKLFAKPTSKFDRSDDSIAVSGVWYNTNQTFVTNLTNSVNCDSTHTLNLIFSDDVNNSVNVSACGSYTSPQGQMFTSSNIFFESYPAANTCDSIVEFNLTISEPDNTSNATTACDSTEINGVWYFEDEMIIYNGTNVYGCDSTHIIDLSVISIDNSVITDGEWILEVEDNPGATYVWYNCDNNEIVSGANSFLFSASEAGSFKVEISK